MYATTVGLPVVPDEAWMRTISSIGTASIPNGYVSRKSLLVVNGSRFKSSSDRMSFAPTPAWRRRSR